MSVSLETLLNAISLPSEIKAMGRLEAAICGPLCFKVEGGDKLLSFLKGDPACSKFDGELQTLGSGAFRTEIEDLADWLIKRADAVGSKQAVCELNHYNSSDEVEGYEVMLLADAYLDAEYKFCNGVQLMKPETFPNHYLASNIIDNSINSILPLPTVRSLLVAPYSQKISHGSTTQAKLSTQDRPIKDLEETKSCLALARPLHHGLQAIAHGIVAPDHLPFINSMSGWSVHPFKSPPFIAAPMIEMNMQQADHLLVEFLKLPDNFRKRLRNSIERLNGYSSGIPAVDAAIDLRICLESIFLSDNNQDQLTYTLSLRAALFMGENLKHRKEIMKLVKKAYGVTSTAVHTGQLPKKDVELLPEVAQIARNSIIKLINEGKVNWQEIELQTRPIDPAAHFPDIEVEPAATQ